VTYKRKEAIQLTGLSVSQFEKASMRGDLKKVGHGLYDKANIDAYASMLAERREVKPANWVQSQEIRKYRSKEVPLILGVSYDTVVGLRKSGHIKQISWGFYDADSVDAFLKEKNYRNQIRAEWHLMGNSE